MNHERGDRRVVITAVIGIVFVGGGRYAKYDRHGTDG
jgi:hypothetical protein